ncbi:hypothetical protein R6L23_01160 [Streptomyces sp. SR27]|uniref:hypothetical protein n=1 Tax=Streptomyces sp. SR27 TaxID=3076630 RepID=UPI00295AB27A|nr:hypothetical protein [Streptomyces sp. SR27]MDV9186855.1 hypothetical protein [Streptomyces sp. SR27]
MLTAAMAAFTPFVLRTESTVKSIAWLFMLICAIAGVAVFVRAEVLLRRLERQAGNGAHEN